MRNLYSAPHLQQIWNHSLFTVGVISELCQEVRYADVPSAKLVAMLHDIGQIILSALGSSYISLYSKLLAQGLYPVQIERHLCGITHAEVGADLLRSWGFPEDMSEAVRHHHTPSNSGSILTSLLYCAECSTNRGEDIYNPVEHDHVTRALGLHGQRLDLGTRFKTDLKLLRFVG
jgi:putative nucleotidyltransferase with HDIG domain